MWNVRLFFSHPSQRRFWVKKKSNASVCLWHDFLTVTRFHVKRQLHFCLCTCLIAVCIRGHNDCIKIMSKLTSIFVLYQCCKDLKVPELECYLPNLFIFVISFLVVWNVHYWASHVTWDDICSWKRLPGDCLLKVWVWEKSLYVENACKAAHVCGFSGWSHNSLCHKLILNE